MRSQKKKKKKRSSCRWRHLFLRLISKKKKVPRLSSATFFRDFCDIQKRGAVNSGCLRFLAGNKNAGFWREKKRRNSQNFSAKMPEKISHFSHFFALIGNTEHVPSSRISFPHQNLASNHKKSFNLAD